LTGDTPPEHRLTWAIDDQARTDLETALFGMSSTLLIVSTGARTGLA